MNYEVELIDVTGTCETHGEWASKVFESLQRYAKCPTCSEISAKRDSEREMEKYHADLEKSNRARRLRATKIPKRFIDSTFEGYAASTAQQKKSLETCRRYSERFNEISDKGTSLILLGKPGCGKTHLACAIVQHVAMNLNKTAVYIDIISLIREVRATFNKDSEYSEDGVINYYSTRDLLVIDEVGVQVGSEFEKMIFQDVIDRRYREMLPTIVVSNLSVQDLKNVVGDRAVDRLKDNGGALLSFDWESHRGAA